MGRVTPYREGVSEEGWREDGRRGEALYLSQKEAKALFGSKRDSVNLSLMGFFYYNFIKIYWKDYEVERVGEFSYLEKD